MVAAGLGALVGWPAARRQLPGAVTFCLAVALGASVLAGALRPIDGTDGAVIQIPVIIGTAVLAAALAANAPSVAHGASWAAATMAAGTIGALIGADRPVHAVILATSVTVVLHRRSP